MNLIFRVLWVFIGSLFRPRLGFLDESVLTFRVLPNDLDTNLHMNNGRYLTIMDLGRLDLIQRCGLTSIVIKRRWMPVVGSQVIRFRRSLGPFQRYTLHSRVLGWDDRFVYMDQRFRAKGHLAAAAVVKAAIVAQGETLKMDDVAAVVGFEGPVPELPAEAVDWVSSEAWLRDVKPAQSAS